MSESLPAPGYWRKTQQHAGVVLQYVFCCSTCKKFTYVVCNRKFSSRTSRKEVCSRCGIEGVYKGRRIRSEEPESLFADSE